MFTCLEDVDAGDTGRRAAWMRILPAAPDRLIQIIAGCSADRRA
jgi:hypothetical protein